MAPKANTDVKSTAPKATPAKVDKVDGEDEDPAKKVWPKRKKNWFPYYDYDGMHDTRWKIISCPFEQFFGDEAKEFNDFVIFTTSKKLTNRKSTRPNFIIYHNNEILNRDKKLAEEFMYRLYVMKKKVDTTPKGVLYTPDNFIRDMISVLLTENIVTLVRNYVDDKFEPGVINSTNKKRIPALTFEEDHYKIIHSAGVVVRLTIPLIIEYVYQNDNVVADDIIVSFVKYLTEIFEEGQYNVLMKLRILIQQRVRTSMMANQVIWDKIGYTGKFLESKTQEVFRNILTTSFSKLDFSQNIIAFISVIARKGIHWEINGEFRFNIHSLSDADSSGDDESSLTESEIFDSYNRKDELKLILRSVFIPDTIHKISKQTGIVPSMDEIKFYENHSEIHNVQKFCIFQFFAPYFSGAKNIYACSRREYISLMIILVKHLENLGLTLLPEIITGRHTSHVVQFRMNKAIEKALMADPRYVNILDEKYSFAAETVVKKDIIRSVIMRILNNKYEYCHFHGKHNGSIIPKDEEIVREEILKYFSAIQ